MTIHLCEKIDNFEKEEIDKLKHFPRERELLAPRIREFSKSLFRSIALMQANGTSLPQITRLINQSINKERAQLKECFELYKSEVQKSHAASRIIDQILTEPRPVREPISVPARTSLQSSFEAHLNERIMHNMATARAISALSDTVGTAVNKTLSLVPYAEKIREGAVYTLKSAKEAGKLIVSAEARQFLRRFMDRQNRPLVNELQERGFSESDALQYAHDSKTVAISGITLLPVFKGVKVAASAVSRKLSNNLSLLSDTALTNISQFSRVVENIQPIRSSPALSRRFVTNLTAVTERDIGLFPKKVGDTRFIEASMKIKDKTLLIEVEKLEISNNAFSLPRAINNALKIAKTNQCTYVEIRGLTTNTKLLNVLARRYREYRVRDPSNPYLDIFRIPITP